MVDKTGLRVRMAIVGGLLFGLYLYVAQLLLAAGFSLTWVFLGIGGFVVAQYKLGYWLALRSVDAQGVNQDDYPEVHQMVTDLSAKMELDRPRVMIADMGTPNAFAVGRRGNGVVVLSQSLIELLDTEELEGVIAHELAHIENRDVVMMVLGQAIAALVGILVYLGTRVIGRRSAIVAILAWIFGTIAQFLVSLLVLALSRYREYVADEAAVSYTDEPEALASALTKISTLQESEMTAPTDESVQALLISTPGSSLLSTHPPVTKRVDRIAPAFTADPEVDTLANQLDVSAVCPHCETPVSANWEYCDNCGGELTEAS